MRNYAITDSDLLAELFKLNEGTAGYKLAAASLEKTQAKRDAERADETGKIKVLSTLTPVARRLAVLRDELSTDDFLNKDNLRYLPSALAICGLPYRRLEMSTEPYVRKQGQMSIVVQAGHLMSPKGDLVLQPVPWGPKARLIMAHLSTKAVQTNSPDVETADTLTEFMRDMHMEATGGTKGSLAPFKEQLRALAACTMQFHFRGDTSTRSVKTSPIETIDIWFGDDPDQKSLWPTSITFSAKFFSQLKEHALPIDVRALRAFSTSARKLDLLFWLVYRSTRINSPFVLSWAHLKEQFGGDFNRPGARDRAFRAQLADDLKAIHELYPTVRFHLSEAGLEVNPTDPRVFGIPAKIRKLAPRPKVIEFGQKGSSK